jgi:CheY-like chemotaxis protein/anti-sigma regulatory factor (Ser/Thr protein kinase)
VCVDPLEIERALVNLVVNARDVMPGGGIVKISTALGRVDGALSVELSVADQGPGIAEADLPHIFEPFYTTRQAAGGTGLGLATVLGTAEQHGGSVRVEKGAGGGSVFTICLPPAEVPPDSQTSHPAPGPAMPAARVIEFLVVDDEPMIANVTRRILGALGHVVRVATQPNEALAIWADHAASIDLVICDVVMAPMRGPELVERMADVGVAPRVLFITGYSEEAVRSELKHPVLAKPFSASALWKAINDVLEAGPDER